MYRGESCLSESLKSNGNGTVAFALFWKAEWELHFWPMKCPFFTCLILPDIPPSIRAQTTAIISILRCGFSSIPIISDLRSFKNPLSCCVLIETHFFCPLHERWWASRGESGLWAPGLRVWLTSSVTWTKLPLCLLQTCPSPWILYSN